MNKMDITVFKDTDKDVGVGKGKFSSCSLPFD